MARGWWSSWHLSLPLLCLPTVYSPHLSPPVIGPESDKEINVIGHRTIARGSTFYLKNEIGKEFSAAFEQKTAMRRDPAIADYLARLTQKLARNSDADLAITLRVIDSDEVNAFTLPGGYQYVSLGLLLRLAMMLEV